MARVDTVAPVGRVQRLPEIDVLRWTLDKDAALRSTPTTVAVLDRAPDRERLERRLDLVSRRHPRLRARVVGHPLGLAPPQWEIDPHTDLRYHLRWARAARGGPSRDLFDVVEPLAERGFDRARPPWELTVVEGLSDGRAALVGRVHAVLAGRNDDPWWLLRELADVVREPDPAPEAAPLPAAPAAPDWSPWRRLRAAMDAEARRQTAAAGRGLVHALTAVDDLRSDPVRLLTGTVRAGESLGDLLAPVVEPLSPLLTGRSLGVRVAALAFPRAALARAAALVSGDLQDAVLAGVAGGLNRYHQWHGHTQVGALRTALDPDDGRGLGPGLAPRFALPLDLDDPLERLHAVHVAARSARDLAGAMAPEVVAAGANRLPATLTTALAAARARGVDVVVTCVPAPAPRGYLAGAALDVPLVLGARGATGLAVTVSDGGDDVHVGLTVDPAAAPDTDRLTDCLRDSFEEIAKLV